MKTRHSSRRPTARQRACFEAFAVHGSSEEAAYELGISVGSLKRNIGEYYRRIGAKSGVQAAYLTWGPGEIALGHRVYTGGTFDCFHAGHVNFLRQCRALAGEGGEVVVSLNTDEFITEYKRQAPVISYAERAMVLEAVRYVDRVVPNTGGKDSRPAILNVDPDIVAVGDDWERDAYFWQMGFNQGWLNEHKIALRFLPRYKGISTTEIRGRIRLKSGPVPYLDT